MRRRGLVVTAAVAAIMLVLGGCGGSGGDAGGDSPDDPFRVMITAGISAQGVLAANAQTSVLAAKAGVEHVNAAGGIAGREIELTVVDDQGDPTTAVTELREAIASDAPPDVYLNSGPSQVATATLPILNKNEILSFNIGPTENSSDPNQFPLNFDLSPGPPEYARSVVAHAKQQGYASIGVIHSSSAYGEVIGPAVREAALAEGIEVVGMQQYDTEALDMTPQLQALASEQPDVLFVDGYGAPVGYLLQSKERLGWQVPMIGDTSIAATSLISSEPPAGALGTPQVADLSLQVFQSTSQTESSEQVTSVVETMAGLGDINSTLILAYNYDALPLVAAAAEAAGGADDPTALAEKLEDPAVQENAKTAILPKYNFTPASHTPNVGVDAFAFVPPSPLVNGQFVGQNP